MAGGPRLHGAQRGTPRRVAHEGFVADNGRDSSPSWAPFFASPWTTAPTKLEKGGFGVNADGRLESVNPGALAFLPVVGNVPGGGIATATRTMVDKESGGVFYFQRAAGSVVTLPTPRVGMFFTFLIMDTITSNAAKIITNDPANVFLQGWFRQSTDSTYTVATRVADGFTHVAWNGNGTTTGGIAGDILYFHCTNATYWNVWGFGSATGTEATPFATS